MLIVIKLFFLGLKKCNYLKQQPAVYMHVDGRAVL